MRRHFRAPLVATIACIAACGGDSDGSGPLAIEDYPNRLSASFCGQLDRCCDWADLEEQGITSYSDCVAAIEPYFEQSVGDLADSLAAGRIAWDADLAGSCMADIESSSCGVPMSEQLSGCDAVLTPLVEAGGACRVDFDCISDLCSFEDAADTEGTCASSAVGDPCALSCFGEGADRDCYDSCSGDLVCRTSFDGSGEGVSSCVEDDDALEGESCTSAFCDGALFCNDDEVCEAPRADGQGCESDDQCDSGTCTDQTCAVASSCSVSF